MRHFGISKRGKHFKLAAKCFLYFVALWLTFLQTVSRQTRLTQYGSKIVKYTEKPKLRLLTTHFEREDYQKGRCSHTSEVVAALAFNSKNCYIDTIHVLFESKRSKASCNRLFQQIHVLREAQGDLIYRSCAVNFECTIVASQPTYYDVFSISKSFVGDVVILANADMVFDSSVHILANLQRGVLNTIATNGLDVAINGASLLDEYRALSRCDVNTFLDDIVVNHLKNESEKFEEETGLKLRAVVPNRCYPRPRPRLSWDAYVFHPEDINVVRQAFRDTSGREWYMNELGAENAALGAIVTHSPALHSVTQVCDIIHMYSFHTQAKTHGDGRWVQSSLTFIASDCNSTNSCFFGE